MKPSPNAATGERRSTIDRAARRVSFGLLLGLFASWLAWSAWHPAANAQAPGDATREATPLEDEEPPDTPLAPSASAASPMKRIAVVLPESGPYARIGDLQRKGYELARLELEGERPDAYRVRYYDLGPHRGDTQSFIFDEVGRWEPDVIVGPYDSETALRVAAAAEALGVPLIVPTASVDSLTERPGGAAFRIAPPQSVMAETAAGFVAAQQESLGVQRVRLIVENTPFGLAAARDLQAAMQQVEIAPVRVETFEPGRYRRVTPGDGEEEEENEDPGRVGEAIIFVTRNIDDAATITRRAPAAAAAMIGWTAAASTPTYRAIAARHVAEQPRPPLFIVTPWQDDSDRPVTRRFVELFRAKYQATTGLAPQHHAAQAYAALIVAAEALDAASRFEGDVMATLRSQSEAAGDGEPLAPISTPVGDVSFRQFGNFHRQNPAGAVVQRITPEAVVTVYPAHRAEATVTSLASGDPPAPTESPGTLRILLENEIIALFAIVALGMLIGRIEVASVSLGSSGVLFVALVFGAWQLTVPAGVGTLGLVLFVYCVGLAAGPTFFRAFVSQGANLAAMGAVLVTAGAVVTIVASMIFGVETDFAVGIFAGAMTSTPGLAAARDAVGGDPIDRANVAIGYGIAYPFGVVGVVLFVQLLPRLLRANLDEMAGRIGADRGKDKTITRALVEVNNPALFGKHLVDVDFLARSGCQVARVLQGERLVPVGADLVLDQDQHLMVVGKRDDLEAVIGFLGRQSDRPCFMDSERERMQVVVTSAAVVGKSLRDLDLIRRRGVTISRIARSDVGFVPKADTVIEKGDVLTAVGEQANLRAFAAEAGHRSKFLDETDLISLTVGITLGIVLGMIPLGLPGAGSFVLGKSGGPLFVALILGHFGRIGRISSYIPRATRMFMMELGLVFFLANAGVRAGARFLPVLQEHGVKLFIVGALVTAIPMAIGFLFAVKVRKINLLEALGGTCGGMTSTPGLGAITAKTDSDLPVVAYATAYPVALILMTIFAQLIVAVLG